MSLVVGEAFAFMRRVHAGHKRKNGAPYSSHPEAVFNILTREFPGPVSEGMQVIALLHDTLEMSDIAENDISGAFGLEVLGGVKLLTRQKGESFAVYAARLRGASREVRLVKAADRLHNLRETPLAGAPVWALEYVQETREHIFPLVDDAWFLSKLAEAIVEIERVLSVR